MNDLKMGKAGALGMHHASATSMQTRGPRLRLILHGFGVWFSVVVNVPSRHLLWLYVK